MKTSHLLLAGIAAIAVPVVIAVDGCSGGNDATPGTGGGEGTPIPPGGGGSGGGSCATPNQGCACSTEGELVQCGEVSGQGPDGKPICAMGVRRCIGGTWTRCDTLTAVTPEVQSHLSPLFTGPPDGGWPLDAGGCSPCDPYCTQTNTTPYPDGGLIAVDSGPLPIYDAHVDGPPQAPVTTYLADAGISTVGVIYHELPPGGSQTDPPFVNITTNVNSVDLYFLVNATNAAQPSISNLKTNITTVVNAINTAIPGTAYGVGRYTNYESWPYASQSSGNVVFAPIQYMTQDPGNTVTAATFANIISGAACGNSSCFQTTPYVVAQGSMTALYELATNQPLIGWAAFGTSPIASDWWYNVFKLYGQTSGAGQSPYYPTSGDPQSSCTVSGSGTAASITTVTNGVATITGLTGMTAAMVGTDSLLISGAQTPGNNSPSSTASFPIVAYNSATSVNVSNPAALGGDPKNGTISWQLEKLGMLGAGCMRSSASHIVMLLQSAPAQEGPAGSFPYYQYKPRYFPPAVGADYTTENSWYWMYSPSFGGNNAGVTTAGTGPGGPAIPVEPSWTASTAFVAGQIVQPTTPNGAFYTVATAGTSGTAQPTWPTTVGATVTDGTVVWRNTGQYVSNNANAGGTGAHLALSTGAQTGTTASITANNCPGASCLCPAAGDAGAGSCVLTLTGLYGMSAEMQAGNDSITISGAATAANNGTFPVVAYLSPTSVTIANAGGIANDTNNGAIHWSQVGNVPHPRIAYGHAIVPSMGWAASSIYQEFAIISPAGAATNGYSYRALNAGTSGSAAPTWPQTPGSTVLDGTITWQWYGASTPPAWKKTTAFAKGVLIQPKTLPSPNNGYYFEQINASGTTGSTEPTWPTTCSSTTVNDGTASWVCAGSGAASLATPLPGSALFPWAPSKAYTRGTVVLPSAGTPVPTSTTWPTATPNGFYYEATTGGTSSASAPTTWPATVGATLTDGTVTWTAPPLGATVPTWQPSTTYGVEWVPAWRPSAAYAVNMVARPATQNGYYYTVTVAGTSAATQPAFSGCPTTTFTDGSVTWKCVGVTNATNSAPSNNLVEPSPPNGFYYLATSVTPGVSGTTQPTWTTSTLTPVTVTDNGVTWTPVVKAQLPEWTASTGYALGTVVVPQSTAPASVANEPDGFLYQVTTTTATAATGGSAPAWPTTVGGTVADNTNTTWTNVGLANLSSNFQLGGTSSNGTVAFGTYDPRVTAGTLTDPATNTAVPSQTCTLPTPGNALFSPAKSSGATTMGLGPDLAYDFTIPTGGSHYWFDTAGSAYDTVLYIVNRTTGLLMACADDSFTWLSASNASGHLDGTANLSSGGAAQTANGTTGVAQLASAILGWLPAGNYTLVVDKYSGTNGEADKGAFPSYLGGYTTMGDPGLYELNAWTDATDPGMAGNPKFTGASTPGYSQTIAALGPNGPLGGILKQNTYVMGMDLSGVACGGSPASWENNYTLWSLQNIAHDTGAVLNGQPQVFSVQSNGAAGPASPAVTTVNTTTCAAAANIGTVVSSAIQNFTGNLAQPVSIVVSDFDDLTDFDGTWTGTPSTSNAGPTVLTPNNIDDATFVSAITVNAVTGCSGATSAGQQNASSTQASPTGAGYASCNPGSQPSITVQFHIPATFPYRTNPQIFYFIIQLYFGTALQAQTPVVLVVPASVTGYQQTSQVSQFSAVGQCGANQKVVWGNYYWNQGSPCQLSDGGVGNCIPEQNPPTINTAVDSNITWYVAPAYNASQFNDAGVLTWAPDGGTLTTNFDGGLPGELPYPLAVATYATQTGAASVGSFLANPGDAGATVFGAPQFLQIRAVLNPTSNQLHTPTLTNYNLTVSCVDSQ